MIKEEDTGRQTAGEKERNTEKNTMEWHATQINKQRTRKKRQIDQARNR